MSTGDGVTVSHADRRSGGTGLSAAGASQAEGVRALRAYLEGEGDPWGDDELGSMVGAAYREVTRQALEVYDSLVEHRVTTGENVETSSVNYRSVEQRSEEETARLLRAVQQA
ncbi:hypothetical protein [Streptosporangium sp. NPDC003464]